MDSLATTISRRDLRKGLENLPIEVNATYDETMKRIEGQIEGDRKLAEQVGFITGIPRVGVSDTAPVPFDTVPLKVTGIHRTVSPATNTVLPRKPRVTHDPRCIFHVATT